MKYDRPEHRCDAPHVHAGVRNRYRYFAIMKPACSGDLIKVLFVDDDADDRMLFQSAMDEIHPACALVTASNGVEALRMLSTAGEDLPDVIFMDINMPQMNGRELLLRIRDSQEFRQVPVVVFSTSTSRDDRQYMQEIGAHSYLVKPVSYSQLCVDLREKLTALGFAIPGR